jgi:regulator of protease activity HflC (stomatin/prohibitin superfamily)
MIFQIVIGILIVAALFLASGINIVKEYERGVILRLGRLVGVRGPGIIYVIPFIETMDKVSLRVITLDVPAQEVMTRDNVPVEVNAVVYFRVDDPEDAIIQINNYHMATSQIAQTTLRSVLGQSELDELLAEREKINQELQQIIDDETDPWGVKVTAVEVKNVELPDSMQRAMARQAEAERERRAKVIAAEGEHQASRKLNMAAKVIGQTEVGIQLRFLQTLTEISSEETTTIAFPIPVDTFSNLMNTIQDVDPEDMPDPEKVKDAIESATGDSELGEESDTELEDEDIPSPGTDVADGDLPGEDLGDSTED